MGSIEDTFVQERPKKQMAYSSYMMNEGPSMTCMKYYREGKIGSRDLQPGERQMVARGMEESGLGFRRVSRGLREAENVRRVRESCSMERTPVTSYYKSVVATRSSKGSGNIFYCDQVGRFGTFYASRRL